MRSCQDNPHSRVMWCVLVGWIVSGMPSCGLRIMWHNDNRWKGSTQQRHSRPHNMRLVQTHPHLHPHPPPPLLTSIGHPSIVSCHNPPPNYTHKPHPQQHGNIISHNNMQHHVLPTRHTTHHGYITRTTQRVVMMRCVMWRYNRYMCMMRWMSYVMCCLHA